MKYKNIKNKNLLKLILIYFNKIFIISIKKIYFKIKY